MKKGIPFAAAILAENDMDYAVARNTAAEVVSALPFEKVPEEALERALALVDSCETVIDAGLTLGETNRCLEQVLQKAKELGKLTARQDA